jgi:hypothetical protein
VTEEMPVERRQYIVGAFKVPYEERDVAHTVLTPEDDRGFFDVIDADDDPGVPVGARVVYRVDLTEEEAALFEGASNCRYVELDGVDTPDAGSTAIPRLATLQFMRAAFATGSSWHGRDVLIGLVDSGTTAAVRGYLDATLVARQAFTADDPGFDGVNSEHGCLVASCLIPVGGKFLDAISADANGGTQISVGVAAMKWCADMGAQIVNFSYSGPTASAAREDGVQYLAARGVQLFCCMGNSNLNAAEYPAAYSTSYANVHSSISFDEVTGKRSTFSNYTATASGCAPGTSVLGLTPEGTVTTWSGTSASSPHMARLCAMGCTGGRYTASQVGSALKANCRNTGQPAAEQGGGAYSLLAAMTALGAVGLSGVFDFQWHEAEGSPTSQTSITFGNVEAGRVVGLRVCAVDSSGNQGPWSDVVEFESQSDNTPPPVASTPEVSAWFRTLNVTWDGKGSQGEDLLEAAPDFASGGGVEIHVGQTFNFAPHRPVTAEGKLDLVHSTTYVQTLYGPGTWNVPGLSIGVTYFARFVSFDRNGNAAEPSACSAGVLMEQLVNIDIGPNAIGREQIIDLEVVRAKIADGAINTLKVEEISAGLISAGTMNAQVAVGGRFYTQPLANGNRVEFDAAGIRLYRGSTVVGRWQVSDASVLVTGTYLSGITGRRINILPSGTMFFYPDAGVNYGFLENANGDLRLSGQVNTNNLAGYVTIDETRAALTYGTSDFSPRTRFQVDPIATAAWAPIISNRVDLTRGNPDALGARAFWLTFDGAGDVGPSILHWQATTTSGRYPHLYGANNDIGIIFDAGFMAVVHNNIAGAPIRASSYDSNSSATVKTNIRSLAGDVLDRMVRPTPSRMWQYRDELGPRPSKPGTKLRRRVETPSGAEAYEYIDGEWTAPRSEAQVRFGPLWEDLPPELQKVGPDGAKLVDHGSMLGVLWEAVRELADRLESVRHGPPNDPGHGPVSN